MSENKDIFSEFITVLFENKHDRQKHSQISGKQISQPQPNAAPILTSSPQCHHGNATGEKHEGCLDPNCYGKQRR